MEKELEKMKINELYELKNIILDVSEKYSKMLSSYSTNGMMDRMITLNKEEKEFQKKKNKYDNIIKKIENLIEEKIIKNYD